MKKGVLKPGMLADIAVLSQDVTTAPAPSLPGTHAWMTMVGGKMVSLAVEAAAAEKQ
jgi:hypothetical protein